MIKKLTTVQIEQHLHELNSKLTEPWALKENKLFKKFIFSDFKQAFSFMEKVAELAESQNHHPEWCNVYNLVEMNLVTHEAGGLTERDFKLANAVEESLLK